MRIGNICYTRRNMGDSPTLRLSSKVTLDSSACYSPDDYCAKKSPTTGCDSGSGDYSGCARTVMDGWAAYDTCENFNYRGLKWHVMTRSESTQGWLAGSYKRGSNGLMLCTSSTTDGEPTCDGNTSLVHIGGIKPGNYSGSTGLVSYGGGVVYDSGLNGYGLYSVRCTTDLTGTGL